MEGWGNQEIAANRPVAVTYEEAGATSSLRKESQREGILRIVSIAGLDRSACGGTHVRATGEIGMLLLGKTEKVRDTIRIEFVCGGRALRRARRDYDALAHVARLFSCTLDDAPAAVVALQARAAAAEKENRLLREAEASRHGRDLYLASDGASGLRFVHRTFGTLGEDVRAEAQAFTSMGPGVYVATSQEPPAVLIARGVPSHQELAGNVDVGAVLKQALAHVGGRGGGTALLAQGRVPNAEDLMAVVREVRRLVAGS